MSTKWTQTHSHRLISNSPRAKTKKKVMYEKEEKEQKYQISILNYAPRQSEAKETFLLDITK